MSRGFTPYAEGSVLIEVGQTVVLCNASVLDRVPPFLKGKEQGWVTAEYGMLPRSAHTRSDREAARGKQSGRTQEIQRLNVRVAALPVGMWNNQAVLDLDYAEDSACDADMNIVMTGSGHYVEVQGTAEGQVFSKGDLDTLLTLAGKGVSQLLRVQQDAWPQQ